MGVVHPKYTDRQVNGTSVLRAAGGWSEDLMIAQHKDSHESNVSHICVKRFERQDVLGSAEYAIPCASGTLGLPCRPTPSLTAEGNLEPADDIQESDEK